MTPNKYERIRQQSLRSFVVHRTDGEFDHVWAHFFEGDNANGSLTFEFIEVGGQRTLRKGYAGGTWTEFWEHIDHQPILGRMIQ